MAAGGRNRFLGKRSGLGSVSGRLAASRSGLRAPQGRAARRGADRSGGQVRSVAGREGGKGRVGQHSAAQRVPRQDPRCEAARGVVALAGPVPVRAGRRPGKSPAALAWGGSGVFQPRASGAGAGLRLPGAAASPPPSSRCFPPSRRSAAVLLLLQGSGRRLDASGGSPPAGGE